MCNCSTAGCGREGGILRFDLEAIGRLHGKVTEFSTRLAGEPRVSLLSSRGATAVEILSEDPKDKRSFLIFQKLGVFGGLEIKLKKFEVNFPKADVVLEFKFDPFGGGAFKFDGTLTIHCENIQEPTGCAVSIDYGNIGKEIKPLVNWDCLKNCAPQCISCGSDWQCWLGCAGGCIIRCL